MDTILARRLAVTIAVASALFIAPSAHALKHKPLPKPLNVAALHPHPRPRPSGPPEILFTFDDGPNLERTPKVLDILEQHHIHAIFFVNGWHFLGDKTVAERSRELLREMVRRGHAVGNHTVHHYFLCGKLGKRVAVDEIEKNADLIEQAIGSRPELFRTPYGSHCKDLSITFARLGITPIGWDIDPQDWKVKNTQKVRDFVIAQLKRMRGRNIILFHDVHQDTVEALPQVLDWLDHENQERLARGEEPIKVLDYSYLLPPHPVVPPLVDGLGRVLIDQVGPRTGREVRGALRFLGLGPGLPWTS